MKDLNFFESYIVKKRIVVDKYLIFHIIGFSLLILIVAYSIFNQIRIIKMSKDITTLQMVIEDKRVKGKIDEINKKNSELNSLKDNISKVRIQNSFIQENATIDDSLLEMITSSIPKDVFLTSLSLYPDEINIIGKAKNQLLIAQLIENLESFESFKGIFVSSISKEDQYYSFILDLSLKEVISYGEDPVTE